MMKRIAIICLAVLPCGAASAQISTQQSPPRSGCAEIERLLDQQRDMVFEDATLEEVAAFLQTNGIPTYVDERALDEIGIGIDTPITFREHAIQLRDGLQLILGSLQLTWAPRNGRLIITTVEAEEARLITKVYDVRHLVDLVPVANWGGGFGGDPARTVYRYDFDSLIETITSTIAPETWEDYGGPGSVAPYYTRRMRVLVIAHTYEMHRRISSILNELAEHGGSRPLANASAFVPPQQPNSFARSPETDQPFRPSVRIRSSQLRTTGQ